MVKSTLAFISGCESFNAGGKAVQDAMNIASGCGYKVFAVKIYKHNLLSPKYWWSALSGLFIIIRCFFASDIILIQYPIYVKLYRRIVYLFIRLFSRKCVVLVHDLQLLRNDRSKFRNEFELLKRVRKLVVHNDVMKNRLAEEGIPADKMVTLQVFDYLADCDNGLERKLSKDICFAGNLGKSRFLTGLSSVISSDAVVMLYGVMHPDVKTGGNVRYMGKFRPDDISDIHGDWGLVWDGDSGEVLSGELGSYMKIISPHKVSLYIAAELPVIVCEQAAVASYVTSRNLGIAVGSLKELDRKLSEITAERYASMLESIKSESCTLKTGLHLKNILSEI